MKENWLEELHIKTIQNYNNYLDVVWDMYYAKTFGILPVKNMKDKKENIKFIPLIKPTRTTNYKLDYYVGVNGKRKTNFFGDKNEF